MEVRDIATAWRRMESALRRRPATAFQESTAALARWDGGTRVTASDSNGHCIRTDMPVAFGGGGQEVDPGWLLCASVSSCMATCIAMAAAVAGIELQSLEVRARSRSDLRGLFGLQDDDGSPVRPELNALQLSVRVSARDASEARLRALVEEVYRRSPTVCSVGMPVPMTLQVEVDA